MKAQRYLLIVLWIAAIFALVGGCTAEQLAKSEEYRQLVSKATTHPVAVMVENSVPYGPLAGAVGTLGLLAWGLLNQALKKHRTETAKKAA
jgi:hypothetical protein